jgi:2-polyprenyl-6-methoxyphenol hydroxylase-like FAD-dependent oxidoreductase
MPQDCVVVGASFAGLACATALADAGARVTVLERKHDPGAKLHTTGILVRDVRPIQPRRRRLKKSCLCESSAAHTRVITSQPRIERPNRASSSI